MFPLTEKGDEPPAKLLDDLFLKTKTAPCIYWLPHTEEQVSVCMATPVCLSAWLRYLLHVMKLSCPPGDTEASGPHRAPEGARTKAQGAERGGGEEARGGEERAAEGTGEGRRHGG